MAQLAVSLEHLPWDVLVREIIHRMRSLPDVVALLSTCRAFHDRLEEVVRGHPGFDPCNFNLPFNSGCQTDIPPAPAWIQNLKNVIFVIPSCPPESTVERCVHPIHFAHLTMEPYLTVDVIVNERLPWTIDNLHVYMDDFFYTHLTKWMEVKGRETPAIIGRTFSMWGDCFTRYTASEPVQPYTERLIIEGTEMTVEDFDTVYRLFPNLVALDVSCLREHTGSRPLDMTIDLARLPAKVRTLSLCAARVEFVPVPVEKQRPLACLNVWSGNIAGCEDIGHAVRDVGLSMFTSWSSGKFSVRGLRHDEWPGYRASWR